MSELTRNAVDRVMIHINKAEIISINSSLTGSILQIKLCLKNSFNAIVCFVDKDVVFI